MKIAFLIYSLSGGGAERQLSYVLSYCSQNNIKAHLVLMNTTIKYKLPENTKLHFLEKSRSNENGFIKALKIPLLAYKYSRLLKLLEITHSVSMLSRPNFINILAKRLTSHKFYTITNELAFPSLQYSYMGFQSKFNKTLINWLYKKSDLIIANSRGNMQDLIDNFSVPKNKITVVNNPIDLEKIRKIYQLEDYFDNNYFNLVSLGRLEIGKNHEMLIRALHELNNPRLRLYIMGEGPLKNYLKEVIDRLNLGNQIFMLGFDPNPFKYLKSSDLFIFGSNHEGFPNVLLEAMACDLPILSTNCKSGPSEIMELKNDNEFDIMITDYGILVPIKNASLMSKGIKYFLENEKFRETCIKNGKRRIKDFEKNHILKQYVEAIKIQ